MIADLYGGIRPAATENPESGGATVGSIILGCLFIILDILGLLFNIGVAVALYHRGPAYKHRCRDQLINLLVSDLTTGIFCVPFHLPTFITGRWDLGTAFCGIWISITLTTAVASTVAVLLLGYESYMFTRTHVYHTSGRRLSISTCAVWSIGFMLCVPFVIFGEVRTYNDTGHASCQPWSMYHVPYKVWIPGYDYTYTIIIFLVCYCIPLFILIYFNIRSHRAERRRRSSVASSLSGGRVTSAMTDAENNMSLPPVETISMRVLSQDTEPIDPCDTRPHTAGSDNYSTNTPETQVTDTVSFAPTFRRLSKIASLFTPNPSPLPASKTEDTSPDKLAVNASSLHSCSPAVVATLNMRSRHHGQGFNRNYLDLASVLGEIDATSACSAAARRRLSDAGIRPVSPPLIVNVPWYSRLPMEITNDSGITNVSKSMSEFESSTYQYPESDSESSQTNAENSATSNILMTGIRMSVNEQEVTAPSVMKGLQLSSNANPCYPVDVSLSNDMDDILRSEIIEADAQSILSTCSTTISIKSTGEPLTNVKDLQSSADYMSCISPDSHGVSGMSPAQSVSISRARFAPPAAPTRISSPLISLALLYLCFFIFVTPYMITVVVNTFTESSVSWALRQTVLWWLWAKTLIHPLIYLYVHPQLRTTFTYLVKCRCCKSFY